MSAENGVLEPDGLPEVPLKAAPWQLHGSGYVLVVRLPPPLIDQHAFVPPSLAGKRRGRTAYVMYMDYASSDCGPYRELLVIPASFDFEPGTYPSITRIYVSSYESVVNGRKNWGIPKDRADFTVQHEAKSDQIAVSRGGRTFAELRLRHFGLTLPVHSSLIPPGMRTLKQHWRGQEYSFTLQAKGTLRMAKLLDWHFDAEFFPDLAQGSVIAAGYLPSFDMTFPVASLRELREPPTSQTRNTRTSSAGSLTT
jgi:hypothetical protein